MSVDREALSSLRIERDEDPEDSGRRKWLWVAGGVVILTIVAFLILGRESKVRVTTATAVATGGGGATSSAVLDANGYVIARRQATVSSEVTGRVTSVRVEEGMKVSRGDLLATIDPENSSAALALTRAQARAAASALSETEVRVREARLERDRAAKLAAEQVGSEQALDRAEAELNALEARLVRQRDEVEVARRQVELQQRSVDDTEIRAPFDGVVISKNAQEGEMISPMSAGGGFTRTGICTIVDMSSLEIEVDVNEAYINRVRADQRVKAILDAYPSWEIPAHVITVVPAADRQKATVRVRIAIDETDPRILPDMGVRVSFLSDEETGSARPVIEIPADALRDDDGTDIVYLLDGETVERRAVSVAAKEGATMKVNAGLTAGDRVVVSADGELSDGAEVIVEEAVDE